MRYEMAAGCLARWNSNPGKRLRASASALETPPSQFVYAQPFEFGIADRKIAPKGRTLEP